MRRLCKTSFRDKLIYARDYNGRTSEENLALPSPSGIGLGGLFTVCPDGLGWSITPARQPLPPFWVASIELGFRFIAGLPDDPGCPGSLWEKEWPGYGAGVYDVGYC